MSNDQPFDTFSAIMNEPPDDAPDHPSLYWTGFHDAAKVAARLAAEPVPVSDEGGDWWGWSFAQGKWFPCLERECRECVTDEGVIVRSDIAQRDERRDAMLRAVRAALAPAAPVVPVSVIERYIEARDEWDETLDETCCPDGSANEKLQQATIAIYLDMAKAQGVTIPEGWELQEAPFKTARSGLDGSWFVGFGIWLWRGKQHVGGEGPTWHDALIAAIEAARETT